MKLGQGTINRRLTTLVLFLVALLLIVVIYLLVDHIINPPVRGPVTVTGK